MLGNLSDSLRKVDDRLGHFRLKEGLEQVVELAREGNRYLNEHEPWRLYKTDIDAAGETLGVSIQIVASLGILLQPFLPSTSKKICLSLTGKSNLPWGSAGQTIIKPGTRIRPLQPLFHKVNAEKLRERIESIRSRAPIEAQA
jgi:methionyl-tRNA synthetase